MVANSRHRSRDARLSLTTAASVLVCIVLAYVQNSAQSLVYVQHANATNTTSIYTTTGNVTLDYDTDIAVSINDNGINPQTAALRGDEAYLYTIDRTRTAIDVVDTGSQSIVQHVVLPANAYAIALSADGSRLYAAYPGASQVGVFSADPITGQLTAVTDISLPGNSVVGLAISPDGSRVYAMTIDVDTVFVIDAATDTQVGAIPVGGFPVQGAVSPDGTRLYVANYDSNTVSVIDTATNTVVATAATGINPTGIVVSPDGAHYYTANYSDQTISQFDATTNTTIGGDVATNGFPRQLTINADGTVLYAGAENQHLAGFTIQGDGTLGGPVDATSEVVGPSIALGTNGNALLAAGKTFLARRAEALHTTGADGAHFTGGTVRIEGSGESIDTPIALDAGGGTIDTNGNDADISTAIGGTGALTKTGAGNLYLTGASTYGGLTTVNDGILTVTGSISGDALLDGGIMAGSGTVGGTVTIANSSILQPGNGGLTTAQFNVGQLALGSSGVLRIKINGPTPGTDYDTIYTTGSSSLAGSLALIVSSTPSPGDTFTIIHNTGAIPITGAFVGHPEGSIIPAGPLFFRVNYAAGADGVDVTLTTVASPALSLSLNAPGILYGQTTQATAILSGGASPTGSLTWNLYGPGDATCTGIPVYTEAVGVSGNGSYVTQPFSPPGVGTYVWTAVYSGDTSNEDSATGCGAPGQTVTVSKADQTITFSALVDRTFGDPPFVLSASGGGSSNPVTFSSQTPGVCTVTGPLVILAGVGTCTIAANQAGNGNYNAAPQVMQSFAILADCSAVSIAQTTLPLGVSGLPYSQALTLTGGALPVTWGVAGALPFGVSFSDGVFSGTPTVRGAFPLTVTATDGNACHTSASLTLPVSAARYVVVGAGSGGAPTVRSFDLTATLSADFTVYATAFSGGVAVAQGDTNGDGIPDLITGAGPGGGPHVQVFDGATGAVRLSFFAFDPSFASGVEVAAGDVTNDGFADVLVAGGCDSTPAPPVVRAFDGRTGAWLRDYPIADAGASCGFHVGAGDITGDGVADVVVGSGPFDLPSVVVIDGASGATLRAFTAYDAGFRGGVYVAAADVTGDGRADIVTGAGLHGGPHVRVFDGSDGTLVREFMAYDPAFTGGVRVAAGDLNGDGYAEVITAAGPGGGPHVRVLDGATGTALLGVFAYDPSFAGGVFVGGPSTLGRMAIDIAERTVGDQVVIAGWALREGRGTVGVDAIHVWAVPVSGGAPVFVGATTPGVARGDVASIFGGEFYRSGFAVDGTLAAGTYDLIVFARNSVTGLFDQSRVIRITVP